MALEKEIALLQEVRALCDGALMEVVLFLNDEKLVDAARIYAKNLNRPKPVRDHL